MDIRLIDYGWSGSSDCSLSPEKNIVFDTDGYLYNKNTFFTNETQYEIQAEFDYNNIDIGLILWYNKEIGYMKYTLNSEEIKLERIKDEGNSRGLGKAFYSETLPAPNTNDKVTLKAVVEGTNIRCYYNGQEVINSEQRIASDGFFGVHSLKDGICSNFFIKSNSIKDWDIHIENGTSVKKLEEGKVSITSQKETFTYIYQDVNTSTNGKYTISYDYSGTSRLEIYDGDTLKERKDFPKSDLSRAVHTIDVTSQPLTTIRIGTNTVGETTLSKPHIEYKSFNTSYTEHSREASSLTFPSKGINTSNGGLGILISPIYDYADSSKELPIFYYNDRFRVYYKEGSLRAVYGLEEIAIAKNLEAGKIYYVYLIWRNKEDVTLSIVDMDGNDGTYNTRNIGDQVIDNSSYLYIGSTSTYSGNLIIDNLVVYKNHVTSGILEEHMVNEDLSKENIVLKANFNKETLLYNKNKIVVPTPKPNSPVIIEKSEGSVYDRVCFINDNKYVIYNAEEVIYNGSSVYELSHANILTIEASAIGNGKIFENVQVKDVMADDRKTGKSEVTILEMDLKDLQIGMPILFKYIIRDTFCLNYSDEYKQYEIVLSNVDDEDLLIQYEEDAGLDRKLVRTVELNPFKSVNNSGFIYIEDVPRTLETFDIKITPDSLIADGFDTATIAIDCLSINGSMVSNVDLEVRSKYSYGDIERYIDDEEKEWNEVVQSEGEEEALNRFGNLVTDEHRSGRFIYKYKTKKITSEGYEMIDQIVIQDKISKIGIQVPIRLVREQ